MLCTGYTHHIVHARLQSLYQPPVFQDPESEIAWGGQQICVIGIFPCGPIVDPGLADLTGMGY